MKKFLLAAAAASVLSATPAMAADWQGNTYGQDAIGVYDVSSTVSTFCKFGTSNGAGGTVNATVDTNSGNGAAEADGRFLLNIQNPNDDTVQTAYGEYHIGYAVCNTPFAMKLNSANGGLLASNTTTDTDFILNVPYQVNFVFDGNGGGTYPINAGETTLTTVNQATAGAADVTLGVYAQDKLLVEGTYSDTLVAGLYPIIGS